MDEHRRGPIGECQELEQSVADGQFAPLQMGAARAVQQDRWERLVAEVCVEAPLAAVWRRLTEAGELAAWLAPATANLGRPGDEAMLDFEDGEFFLVKVLRADGPVAEDAQRCETVWYWRWGGVGPATRVTWTATGTAAGTMVRVTEEAFNPPSDWRSWNGNGWPGILDQLRLSFRTNTVHRWPWRRMGPYVQVHLDGDPFSAWDSLMGKAALQYWLQKRTGAITEGSILTLVMGDASGVLELRLTRVVDANQAFPSYLPWWEFEVRRPAWPNWLEGKLYIEPAGLGKSVFQVFVEHWDRIPASERLEERRIVAAYLRDAMVRAQSLIQGTARANSAHGWS